MSVNLHQIGAILLSSGLSTFIFMIFKWISMRNLNLKAIIVWNYLICVILGQILLVNNPVFTGSNLQNPSIYGVISLGCLFMVTFLLMGKSTANAGAAMTAVASKMSMTIPILIAILFLKEQLQMNTLAGMSLALLAVFMITFIPSEKGGFNWALVGVFIGSGLVDAGMNMVKHMDLPALTNLQFAVLTFSGAAFTGLMYLLITHETQWLINRSHFLWGSLLGTINLFSIFAIYYGIDLFPKQTSLYFTLNNLAVVIFTFVVGIFMKDVLTKQSLIGLVLAVLSIFLLL